MILKKRDRKYPIGNVEEKLTGASYSTGPEGWIYFLVLKESALKIAPFIFYRMVRNAFCSWKGEIFIR